MRLSDDSMAFILLNSDGTQIDTIMKGKIAVEGTDNLHKSYIDRGLLIVE